MADAPTSVASPPRQEFSTLPSVDFTPGILLGPFVILLNARGKSLSVLVLELTLVWRRCMYFWKFRGDRENLSVKAFSMYPDC
eukprot:1194087-Prorocentrum_minimum.AAC.2